MTQFLRDEGSDSEEVLTPLMLDGTYLSRNFATLGPFLTLQPPCHSRLTSLHVWEASLASDPQEQRKDVVGRLFPHEPRYEMRGLEWKESSTMVIPIIIYSARETSWEWRGSVPSSFIIYGTERSEVGPSVEHSEEEGPQ